MTTRAAPLPAGAVWTAARPPAHVRAVRPGSTQVRSGRPVHAVSPPAHQDATTAAPSAWSGLVALLVSVAGWSAAWLLASVLAPTLLLGWQPTVVTSGSMQPLIRPGDVVLVDRDAAVEVGDVVTVAMSTGWTTHRVVEITARGLRTRGDANRTADSTLLRPDQVVGRARLLVPLVGTPVAWARDGTWPPLVAVAVGLVASVAPAPRRRTGGAGRRAALLALAGVAVLVVGVSAATLTGATATVGNTYTAATIAPATDVATRFECGLLGLLGDGIEVTWSASTSPQVTGYRVQRSTDGGASWDDRADLGAGTTAYEDTAALATTYDYRVVALTGTTFTSPSASTTIETPLLCL